MGFTQAISPSVYIMQNLYYFNNNKLLYSDRFVGIINNIKEDVFVIVVSSFTEFIAFDQRKDKDHIISKSTNV